MMLRIFSPPVMLILCLLAALPGFSQDGPKRMDTAVLNFFIGKWSGEGAFANGNKIAADLSFSLSLDSCWLVYEHRDRLPNRYKATSMWGVDSQSGEFVAYCFDNFQGHRQFEGNGLYFEHFIYERTGEHSFKMTYETSRDGISWVVGDWLVFRRDG